MVAGILILEDFRINYVCERSSLAEIRVYELSTGIEEKYSAPQAAFFTALVIALTGGDEASPAEWEAAELAQPKNSVLRFIP